MSDQRWYDGWSITTDVMKHGWVRKTIRLPNSATVKIKMVLVPPNSQMRQVILDLESALYTLTQHDKEYER